MSNPGGYYGTKPSTIKAPPPDVNPNNLHPHKVAPIHVDETPDVLEFKIAPIDIKQGIGGDGAHCAIARAVKRGLSIPMDSDGIHVGGNITIYAEDGVRVYDVPQGASDFIRRFDNWKSQPTSYERPKPFLLTAHTRITEAKAALNDWAARAKKAVTDGIVGGEKTGQAAGS